MEEEKKYTEKIEKTKIIYGISDEEIEDTSMSENQLYPITNKEGEELFDTNENRVLTQEEIDDMVAKLEQKYIEIMDILRISRYDPNASGTPLRLAKMYVKELLIGRYTAAPKNTVFPNRKKVDELIISKGIEVMSVCSHHWQPITGECAIGYIPGEYVIGISKFHRIVNWFARRGQIQEELGEQIADYIEELIKPKALGVVIKARHYCMIARGVRGSEDKSLMVTSVMRGLLLEELNLRNEFLNLIK